MDNYHMTETTNPPGGGSENGGSASSALDDAARLFGSLDDDDLDESKSPSTEDNSSEVTADDVDLDDDQPTEAPEAPKKPDVSDDVLVKLSDGSQVTLAELKAGHLRQADYTRKTQAIAEERRQAQELSARSQQLEQQLAQQLQFVQQVAGQYLPKPPDPALIDTDIFQYQRDRVAYEQKMAEFHQLSQAQQAIAQRAEEARREAFAREQARFYERLPEYKDPAKFDAFRNDVRKLLPETYGFTEQELAGWADHRVFALVNDALKFRKILNGKKEAIEKAKAAEPVHPVMKPGTRNVQPQSEAQRRVQQAKAEFKKSPDVKSAGALLANLLD